MLQFVWRLLDDDWLTRMDESSRRV